MSSGSSQYQIVGSVAFVRLMQVLTRYVSVGVAMSLVNKSLTELGMTPESMSNIDLPDVIEQTMVGLRAFCPETQLDEMTLDLSSLATVRRNSSVMARPSTVPEALQPRLRSRPPR